METVQLKSPYKTKSGKPWMRNSWVVYLDILGFSAQVKKATRDGTANYLYLKIDGVEHLPEEFVQDLQHHRDLIVVRLQTFFGEPSIWSKYAWVGSYHNHFCNHYKGLADLKVDSSLLAQAPRFLAQVYKRQGDRMFRGSTEVAKLKYLNQWKIEEEPE